MEAHLNSRVCPACKKGVVDVGSLATGATCSHCGRVVEIDFFYSAGIPVVLVIMITFFFNEGHGIAGFVGLGLIAAFTFGYRAFWIRWLPMKHYDDR